MKYTYNTPNLQGLANTIRKGLKPNDQGKMSVKQMPDKIRAMQRIEVYYPIKAIHTNGDAWLRYDYNTLNNSVFGYRNAWNDMWASISFDQTPSRPSSSEYGSIINFMGAPYCGEWFGFQDNTKSAFKYASYLGASVTFDEIPHNTRLNFHRWTTDEEWDWSYGWKLLHVELNGVVKTLPQSTRGFLAEVFTAGLFSGSSVNDLQNGIPYSENGVPMSFAGNIYEYHLSSDKGAIKYDLYPARRRSDGACGLYDSEHDVFYPSATNTPFTEVT